MRTSNISNNMMSIGKMIIGEENRNRELHGQSSSFYTTIHSSRSSIIEYIVVIVFY